MKRCPSCHHENEPGAVHCVSCGKKLEAVDKTAPGEPLMAALGADPTAPPESPEARPLTKVAAGTVVDGKYAIVRVLGEGGMGVVYLARDVHTGIEVVLKAVRPELAHRQDIRERTLAEGRALGRIDHPNVVHLNAVVVQGPSLWLVMPFIDGESLDKTIKRHREQGTWMPLDEVLRIFRQILAGVEAAHREGVIHRDLKPANVLIRKKDGVAKVTDFGIAKPEAQARAGKGNTKGIIGSLWYMSPEQVVGKRDLDKRVDVYALGILLFELLSGQVPFDAESSYELMKMHTEAPLPRITERRPGLPAAIEGILARACAKDRDQRFATCAEFDRALAALATSPRDVAETAPGEPLSANARLDGGAPAAITGAGGETAPASAITAAGATAPKSGRALWIGGLALAVGGAAAAAWALRPGPPPPTSSETTPPSVAANSAAITTSAPSASSEAPAATSLASLVGRWQATSKRHFDAVMAGDALEFRVVDASELAPYDYRDGEARFTLKPLPDTPDVFAVEDLLRPLPPPGAKVDSARARNSCQEVWTEAGGEPLRARYDGERLTVEFAKIEPREENFQMEGKTLVGCVKLRDLPAARLKVVLVRVDASK